MNKYPRSRTLGLGALALIVAPLALADEAGWYGGISIGQSRAKADFAQIARGALIPPNTLSRSDNEENDTGYKVFGGYQFGPHFALEGGYFDLGKAHFKQYAVDANGAAAGVMTGNLQPDGFNFDAVGILPMTDSFSAFAKAGVTYTRTKGSFAGTPGTFQIANSNPSGEDVNYKYGVGLQYALSESWAVRAEAERYRLADSVGHNNNNDLMSVGLVYRFDAHKTPPPAPVAEPVAAPAPTPVAVAEPPPPAPVAAEPPPPPPAAPPPPPARVPTKVSFSADSFFVFDKSDVTPAGKEALDKFAADLKGSTFEVITVTGNTDRIGRHDYNMRLSTRRGEAVKAYLVESAGIPADKIVATGTDGTNPVTKPGDCPGKRVTKKLIACLQPDRRVDIEVSGTH